MNVLEDPSACSTLGKVRHKIMTHQIILHHAYLFILCNLIIYTYIGLSYNLYMYIRHIACRYVNSLK